MQNVVAVIGWIELVGILVILLGILGAKEMPEILKGKRHGIQGFKQVIREVQREVAEILGIGAIRDDGNAYRLHKLIVWLFVALVIAMEAIALGLL